MVIRLTTAAQLGQPGATHINLGPREGEPGSVPQGGYTPESFASQRTSPPNEEQPAKSGKKQKKSDR